MADPAAAWQPALVAQIRIFREDDLAAVVDLSLRVSVSAAGHGCGSPLAHASRVEMTEEEPMSALLTVEAAAAELGTPVRFVRRLVAERRIRFRRTDS